MVNKLQDLSGTQGTQCLPTKTCPCYPVQLCAMQCATTSPSLHLLHIHKCPLYKKVDAPPKYNIDQQIGGVEEDEESDIDDSEPNEEVDGTGNFEPEHIKLYRGKDGQFYQCSQLDDYLYHDKLLAHVPF